MTISIESPEVLALIEKISRLTGEDAETVVQVAVREQLERLKAEEAEAERRAQVYETVKELQALFKEHPEAAVDHGELLYGEDGLPK